jgi:hypothetical protein
MIDDYGLRTEFGMTPECETFDEHLSDYLEATLEPSARAEMDAHASICARCSSILRDIAAIRTEAAALPEIFPSRDLWQGIAARIESAVVSLPERRDGRLSRRWIAIAASLLVIAGTAGVTYLATSRAMLSRRATVATAPATEEPTGPKDSTPATALPPGAESSVASAGSAAGPEPAKSGVTSRREPRAAVASATPRARSNTQLTSRNATEIAYGDEIARLQSVIATRKKDLDPSTVTVIEENLKVIDAALKKSRDALARDPASGLLTDQLRTVLDKKVELLRTVALLPSRT